MRLGKYILCHRFVPADNKRSDQEKWLHSSIATAGKGAYATMYDTGVFSAYSRVRCTPVMIERLLIRVEYNSQITCSSILYPRFDLAYVPSTFRVASNFLKRSTLRLESAFRLSILHTFSQSFSPLLKSFSICARFPFSSERLSSCIFFLSESLFSSNLISADSAASRSFSFFSRAAWSLSWRSFLCSSSHLAYGPSAGGAIVVMSPAPLASRAPPNGSSSAGAASSPAPAPSTPKTSAGSSCAAPPSAAPSSTATPKGSSPPSVAGSSNPPPKASTASPP
mmetsp:Transcript_29317/g.54898  ORF Transcript_29317/g.54898 Transcript_29317/m.54898 type:complete len:281 (+) Transcript_29317:426-1268(+)